MNSARKVAPPAPRVVFKLGQCYLLQLIHEPGDDDTDILFDRKYLHDLDEYGFRIVAKSCVTTETWKGAVTTSDVHWQTKPNGLDGTFLTMSTFTLMNNCFDTIEVNCGSVSCNRPHRVTCQMRECTVDEANEVNRARIERKKRARAQAEVELAHRVLDWARAAEE